MTLQQFKQLEAGTILYDAKYSRRKGWHETVIAIEHTKDGRGIVVPDDVSTLPFY